MANAGSSDMEWSLLDPVEQIRQRRMAAAFGRNGRRRARRPCTRGGRVPRLTVVSMVQVRRHRGHGPAAGPPAVSWAGPPRAGDGNRTRIISLGTAPLSRDAVPHLRGDL